MSKTNKVLLSTAFWLYNQYRFTEAEYMLKRIAKAVQTEK